jgi:Zn-dependent protease
LESVLERGRKEINKEMGRSWKLGTAFGIGIYVNWTVLLLAGYVLYHYWTVGGAQLAVHGLQVLVAVLGCVVLHELGHALMARRFGIGTRDITLYVIGGVARLERMSERPFEEVCIALAGPAVNVAIILLLGIPLFFSLSAGGITPEFFRGNLLIDVTIANVFLVVFNLLPAFPMDGGRVLRALLILPFGRLKATEIAARIGTGFALLFCLAAFWMGPSFLLIGIFAFLAGQQELAMVRYLHRRRQAQPLDVIPVDTEVLDVIPVEVERVFSVWDNQVGGWVLYRNGRPVRT